MKNLAQKFSRMRSCRRFSDVVYGLFVVLLVAGCGSGQDGSMAVVSTPTEQPDTQQTLTVYGPPQLRALAEMLGPVLQASGMPYEIRLWEGNSDDAGVRGLLDGTFDMVIMTGRPEDSEQITYYEFVRTPVTVVVNASLGVESLTKDELHGIFNGEITNWSEITGVDQSISVFVLGDSTMTEVIRDRVMHGSSFTESRRVLNNDEDVLSVVAGIPGAVGYVLLASTSYSNASDVAAQARVVAIDGKLPSDPDYEIISTVGMAILSERTDFFAPLFDWGRGFYRSEAVRLLADQFDVELVLTQPPAMTPFASGPD